MLNIIIVLSQNVYNSKTLCTTYHDLILKSQSIGATIDIILIK